MTANKSEVALHVVAWTAKEDDLRLRGNQAHGGRRVWWLVSDRLYVGETQRENVLACLRTFDDVGRASLTAASLEMLVPSRDRCHCLRNHKAQSNVLLLCFFLSFCLAENENIRFSFWLRTVFPVPFLFFPPLCFSQRK